MRLFLRSYSNWIIETISVVGIQRLTPVLLNVFFLFFIHLNLEFLTRFPASNNETYFYLWNTPNLIMIWLTGHLTKPFWYFIWFETSFRLHISGDLAAQGLILWILGHADQRDSSTAGWRGGALDRLLESPRPSDGNLVAFGEWTNVRWHNLLAIRRAKATQIHFPPVNCPPETRGLPRRAARRCLCR